MIIKSVTRFYLVSHVNESPIPSRLMVTDRTQALDYFWSQPCDDELIDIQSFDIVDVIDTVENGCHFEYKLRGMSCGTRYRVLDAQADRDDDDLTLEQLLDYDDSRNTLNIPFRGCNTDDPSMREPITYNDLIIDIIRDIRRGDTNRGSDITGRMGII